MPFRYTAALSSATGNNFLVAGAQGLTVTSIVVYSPVAAGAPTSCLIQRATSVVGGTPQFIAGRDDPAPAPLTIAVATPTSYLVVGRVSDSEFAGPVSGHDVLAESGPLVVAPGNALYFQCSGTAYNIHFEE